MSEWRACGRDWTGVGVGVRLPRRRTCSRAGCARPFLFAHIVFSGRLVFTRLRVMVALLRYLRGNVSFVDRKEESV